MLFRTVVTNKGDLEIFEDEFPSLKAAVDHAKAYCHIHKKQFISVTSINQRQNKTKPISDEEIEKEKDYLLCCPVDLTTPEEYKYCGSEPCEVHGFDQIKVKSCNNCGAYFPSDTHGGCMSEEDVYYCYKCGAEFIKKGKQND